MLETTETPAPDSLDAFLALATFSKSLNPECELLAAPLDFAHAYKHIGIPQGQEIFATHLLEPHSGSLMGTKLRTQPIGSARAPSNWRRVANFLKWPLALVSRANLYIYADDSFMVENAEAVKSAY